MQLSPGRQVVQRARSKRCSLAAPAISVAGWSRENRNPLALTNPGGQIGITGSSDKRSSDRVVRELWSAASNSRHSLMADQGWTKQIEPSCIPGVRYGGDGRVDQTGLRMRRSVMGYQSRACSARPWAPLQGLRPVVDRRQALGKRVAATPIPSVFAQP